MPETFTTNYNWTKPEVGASTNSWGGYLNSDLDGIDTTIHGIDVSAVREAPTGSGVAYARKNSAWSTLTHNDITDWAANAYSLPVASTTVLGGVKVDGTTITIAGAGVISASGSFAAGIVIPGPADLKVQTVTQSGGSLSVNRANGENVAVTLSANITSVAVSAWPAAGTTGKVRFVITNGGAFTMSGWPAGTIWPAATPPVLTSGSGKKDIVLLMSDDGGTTIFGSVVGQDYR